MPFASRVPVIVNDPSDVGRQLGFWTNQNTSALADEERARQYWDDVNRRMEIRDEDLARQAEAQQWNRGFQEKQVANKLAQQAAQLAAENYRFGKTEQLQRDQLAVQNARLSAVTTNQSNQDRVEAIRNGIYSGVYKTPKDVPMDFTSGLSRDDLLNLDAAFKDNQNQLSEQFRKEWGREQAIKSSTDALLAARRKATYARMLPTFTGPATDLYKNVLTMSPDQLDVADPKIASSILQLSQVPGVVENSYRFGPEQAQQMVPVTPPKPYPWIKESAISLMNPGLALARRYGEVRDYWNSPDAVAANSAQAEPMPTDKALLQVGKQYITPRGVLVWDGVKFVAPQ